MVRVSVLVRSSSLFGSIGPDESRRVEGLAVDLKMAWWRSFGIWTSGNQGSCYMRGRSVGFFWTVTPRSLMILSYVTLYNREGVLITAILQY